MYGSISIRRYRSLRLILERGQDKSERKVGVERRHLARTMRRRVAPAVSDYNIKHFL